ncbi:MAG: ribosomal L7Ae/L30e/S12e/Gadd45 family protein [Peptococcaceae bacterium]|jgi:large subunit ribosomal protein L7A|nr:ribosomal L7Ae/L30e/S12e/Gadd45 family protein [Peptococcaceae bacterium]
MLDETLKHAPRKVIGLKQTQRALEREHEQIEKVYIAMDAEPHILLSVIGLCQTYQIEIEQVPTMKELGLACKIEVGAATIAILKDPVDPDNGMQSDT